MSLFSRLYKHIATLLALCLTLWSGFYVLIYVNDAWAQAAPQQTQAPIAQARSAIATTPTMPMPSAQNNGDAGDVRHINLGSGKSVIVDLPRDAAEIFIADPKIISAVVRSARRLYIIANTGGQTSVFALDQQGNRIATLDVVVGRDVAELSEIIKTAVPTSHIVPKTVNDTIILTGTVESAAEAQMALDIAKGFVTQASATGQGGTVVNSLVLLGRDQVMVHVTIAEVRRTIMKQLGITNAVAQGNWGSVTMNNSLVNQLTTGGATIGSAALNGLSTQLQAYERNGAARILAEPTVTAVSGENAKFTAGGEIPVPAGETCANGACSTGVTFKPYGVTLNFAPVVLTDGKILMRIATEVTELDPSVTFSFNSSSVSGFRTRKNEATIELPSGGSIATAGLIQTTSQATINGLPGLMNLPVLGALFRSRDYQRQETELVIIVTPYIAKSVSSNELPVPGQNLLDAKDSQALLLGTMNRIYAPNPDQANLARYRGPIGFIND